MNFTKAPRLFILPVVLLGAACSGGSGSDAAREDNPDDVIDGGGPAAGGATPATFGTPDNSQIRPGVLVAADGSQCTSNFIYGDAAGNYYIGAAAHCFSPDTNSGIDSCETRNLAMGTAVSIENADHDGTLYYSSWPAMQDNRETAGSATCRYNDFALVRIDSRDNAKVHPAAIEYEGPTGLLRGNANVGDEAYSYGQSPFHNGIRANEEKEGSVSSQTADGWQYSINFDNPGLSGDSGSAVLHETGRALGVLTVVSSCIGICPPVNNGVVSLEMAMDYANDFLSNDVRLVTWSNFNR